MADRPLGGGYRALWAASAVSNLGDGVRKAALPLLAASLTRDPALVAGLAFAGRAPWLLLALHAGALTDRSDRRTVLWTTAAARAVVVAVVAVAVAGGWHGLALLYAAAFLLGAAEVLFDNAAQTIVPALVPADRLEAANARLYAAEVVADNFAGPPLGGALFAAAAAVPFGLDAASFALCAALVALLPRCPRPPARATSISDDIREGVRWLLAHRVLRTLGAVTGALNMMFSAYLSIFVLFALDVLGTGATGFGVLLAAGTAGSLAGTLAAARAARAAGTARALRATVALLALSWAAIGLTSSAWVVGAANAAIGFGVVLWNVVTVSLRQAAVPPGLLGRVNSAYRLLAWGAMPLGAALGGAVARGFGLRAPFLLAAVVAIVVLAVALRPLGERALADARRGA